MSSRRASRRAAAVKAADAITDTADRMSRPRRSFGALDSNSGASISKGPTSPNSGTPSSMRLSVTLPPSKLRLVLNGNSKDKSPSNGRQARPSVNSRDPFVGGEIMEGRRARNVKKSYVVESESEEEDEEMEDVVDDEDAEGEDDDDLDAEGEEIDEDAEGDVDMEEPLPPTIKISSESKSGKVTISAKPTGRSDGMTVEQKELLDDSDDDELSELASDLEEEEETMLLGNEEDAEGEDDDEEPEEEEEEEEADSDDETPAGGSRASTPDLTKLTKRQRARLEEGNDGHLLALPDGRSFSLTRIFLTYNPQRSRSKNTSQRRSTPCVVLKWPVAVRTLAKSVMRRRRYCFQLLISSTTN
jgi:Ino eighty subunit 2